MVYIKTGYGYRNFRSVERAYEGKTETDRWIEEHKKKKKFFNRKKNKAKFKQAKEVKRAIWAMRKMDAQLKATIFS